MNTIRFTLRKRFGILIRRVRRLPLVLRPRERSTIIILMLVILVSLLGRSFGQERIRPAFGGTYTEGFVGQPRFINPILATSDNDRSIARLLYSGLAKIGINGELVPDLSEQWTASDGNRIFTFRLRQNIVWHDGKPFRAADVVHTIELIKDVSINSPYREVWKDITVEAPDDMSVVFHLKDAQVTFPWMTTIGLLPAHIGRQQLTTSFVGTGPYKYSKIRMHTGKIESLVLIRNAKWYATHVPYLDTIEAWFYESTEEALVALAGQKILSFAGQNPEPKNLKKYTMGLFQKPILFLNSGSGILTDAAQRTKLVRTEESFEKPIELRIVADDKLVDDGEFQELIQQWKRRNVNPVLTRASIDEIKSSILPKRSYDALLVLVETGASVDPFAYWHSTQGEGSGFNFSRLKNTELDKLLAEQRKSINDEERKQLLTKIDQIVTNQSVHIPFDARTFGFSTSASVHLSIPNSARIAADRYNDIDQWYIKTRR